MTIDRVMDWVKDSKEEKENKRGSNEERLMIQKETQDIVVNAISKR